MDPIHVELHEAIPKEPVLGMHDDLDNLELQEEDIQDDLDQTHWKIVQRHSSHIVLMITILGAAAIGLTICCRHRSNRRIHSTPTQADTIELKPLRPDHIPRDNRLRRLTSS